VVGVGIALVGYMFVDWMRFKRRASREYEAARSDPPLLYSIRDEGIEFTGSDVYAILPWTRIDHWSENDDTLILLERVPLVGLCPSVVAPKSQLGSEELAFLRQKLAENGVRKR
jgi:hypothetical protein